MSARGDLGRKSIVLFAGTWRKNKGVEDLVAAWPLVLASRPDARLIVLGGGVPAGVIVSAFASASRASVEVQTATTDEAAAAVYAGADVFVLPSLFEGTPLTLLEAMRSGLPLVTTDTCGMKDVIRSGVNGLLVPIRSPAGREGKCMLAGQTHGRSFSYCRSCLLSLRRERPWAREAQAE